MIERLVPSRGVWVPAHRGPFDCWCRPVLHREGDGSLVNVHHAVRGTCDTQERLFVTGPLKAPV